MIRRTLFTRVLRPALATVAISLALCGPARATTLITSEMPVGELDTFYCSIVNVGAATVNISMEWFDNVDSGPAGTGATGAPLPMKPGAELRIGGSGHASGDRFYCSFTFTGSKKSIRASLCVVNSSGSCFAHADAM